MRAAITGMRRAANWLAMLLIVTTHAASADEFTTLGMEALDEPLPDLHLVSPDDGARLNAADLRGQVVLLHFWATWCTPCREELPKLAALSAQLHDSRLRVVLIAIDEASAQSDVRAFAARAGVTQPVYSAAASEVSADFWTWGVPVTYVVDGTGRLRGRCLGPRDWRAPAVARALAAFAVLHTAH